MTAKPAKPPIWATDGDNVADPAEGRDVAGWSVGDWLISSYLNFLQHYAGAWLEWLEERILDEKEDGTGDAHSLKIRPAPAVPAGSMNLTGSTGTSGDGGDVNARGGDAKTSGDGGAATVSGGDGIWSNAQGGDLSISTGVTTGAGSADVVIRATEGGAAGAAVRNPIDYVHANAASQTVELAKAVDLTDTGTPQLAFAAQTGLPSSPDAQSIARVDDQFDSLFLRHNDGRWTLWPDIFFSDHTQEQLSVTTPPAPNLVPFNTTVQIPAEFLSVGTIIEILVLCNENAPIIGDWAGAVRLGPSYGSSVVVGSFLNDEPINYYACGLTTIVFDAISGDNLSATGIAINPGSPQQRYRHVSQFDRTVQQNLYFEVQAGISAAGTRDMRLDLVQARVRAWD